METPSDKSKRERRSLWRALFPQGLLLEAETTRFVFVNALDFVMTFLIIQQPEYTEGNPIARYFLYGWGVKGLVYFKFAMVAFIAVLAQWIAYKNLAVASRLMNLATILVAAVVAYSAFLLLTGIGIPA